MPVDTNLGDALVEIRADLALMRADMKKARGIFSTSVKQISTRMKAAGRAMSIALTAPIIAAGFAFVKSATKFETSLSRIQGLVGRSAEEVRGYEQAIIALGPAVAQGPNVLAEAMFFITSAGLEGAAALEALEASAKAASAGLGSVVSVADAVTSAVNAFQGQMLSASDAAGILVATVREGKAAADSIGAAIGRVTGIAAALGATFNDIGAIIALLTRTGSTAEEAGTTIGAFFNTLVQGAKEGSDQADALDEVGLSFEQLRDVIKGPEGTLGVLQLLAEAFKGNEIALGKVFPNVRALRGLLQLVGDRAAETETVFKSLANATAVDLNDAFAVAAQTAEFKFNARMAEMQTLMNQIGKDVLPIVLEGIKSLGQVLRDASRSWAEMNDEAKQSTFKMLALTAAIGPLLLVVGSLLGIVVRLVAVFGFLRVALAAHPLLLVAGILIGVFTVMATLREKTDLATEAYERYRDILDEVNARLEKIKTLTGELKTEEEKLTQAVIAETRAEVLREKVRLESELAAVRAREKRESGRAGPLGVTAGLIAAQSEAARLERRIEGLVRALADLNLAEGAIAIGSIMAKMAVMAETTKDAVDKIDDLGDGVIELSDDLVELLERLNPAEARMKTFKAEVALLKEVLAVNGLPEYTEQLQLLVAEFIEGEKEASGFNTRMAQAKAVFTATRTPLEQFNIAFAELIALAKEFPEIINAETFQRALGGLRETLAGATKGILTDAQKALKQTILGVSRLVGRTIVDIATGVKGVLEGLKDLAKSIADFILQRIIFALIDAGLTFAFPGLFGSAQGNVFSGGKPVPFAKGGIVTGPTVFPLASIAEKGPEAIVPLKRDSAGNLGIAAIGGGGGGFTQNLEMNFTSDVKKSTREEILNLLPLIVQATTVAIENRNNRKR